MLIQKQQNKLIFTRNLNQGQKINDNATMFFIIEEANKTILDFSQGTVKVL